MTENNPAAAHGRFRIEGAIAALEHDRIVINGEELDTDSHTWIFGHARPGIVVEVSGVVEGGRRLARVVKVTERSGAAVPARMPPPPPKPFCMEGEITEINLETVIISGEEIAIGGNTWILGFARPGAKALVFGEIEDGVRHVARKIKVLDEVIPEKANRPAPARELFVY